MLNLAKTSSLNNIRQWITTQIQLCGGFSLPQADSLLSELCIMHNEGVKWPKTNNYLS